MSEEPKPAPPGEVRICLIDDDQDALAAAQRVLGSRGYKLLALAETVGSTNQLRKFDPHLVVLDLNMPAIEGEKLLDIFRQSLKKMPKVIFYSGMNPDDLREIAEQRMADDYVYKGDGLFRLLSCVNYHLYEMGLI